MFILCVQQYNPSCVPWLTSALQRRLYTLTTSRLYRHVACHTFARSLPFFHCSLPKRSNFSTAFAKFAYVVPSGSYSAAKSAVFPIDRNSEYPKMAQECTLDVDVTFNYGTCAFLSLTWNGLFVSRKVCTDGWRASEDFVSRRKLCNLVFFRLFSHLLLTTITFINKLHAYILCRNCRGKILLTHCGKVFMVVREVSWWWHVCSFQENKVWHYCGFQVTPGAIITLYPGSFS